MPDRILARGVVLRTLGWIVIGIMLVAGVTATVFAYNNAQSAHNGAAAVAALKKSSARSECRTRIVNEDDDAFRHRIGALLDASSKRDAANFARILLLIEHAEPTQARINRECPAPLATPKEKH
jgi:hypothetical protein